MLDLILFENACINFNVCKLINSKRENNQFYFLNYIRVLLRAYPHMAAAQRHGILCTLSCMVEVWVGF